MHGGSLREPKGKWERHKLNSDRVATFCKLFSWLKSVIQDVVKSLGFGVKNCIRVSSAAYGSATSAVFLKH